jgi:heme exporter protein CcmD
MDWNADHVGFVFAAYAIVSVMLLGVLLHTLWRAKSLKKTLRDMKLSDPGQKD